MPQVHHPPDRSERGMVLLSTLFALILVAGMAAAMLSTARAEVQSSRTHRLSAQAHHLAEAATVTAEHALLDALANTLPAPAGGVLDIGAHSVPYSISSVGDSWSEIDPDGIRTLHASYLIEATSEVQGFRKTVHRVVDVGLTPIFQFAIFYNPDLELLPGPSMTLSGRVHSNQDIHVGVGHNKTLTIDSNYFRCAGDMLRRRKNDGSLTGGTVRVQRDGSFEYHDLYSKSELDCLGVPSDSGYDSSFLGFDANDDGDLDDAGDWHDFAVGALENWSGSVQTGAHGMRRVEPPSIGSIKRFESVGDGQGDHKWNDVLQGWAYVGPGNGDHRKGRYYENAGLVILDGDAYDDQGFPVLLPPGVVVEKTMYDGREKQDVKVSEIDLEKLAAAGLMPANGLLYAARTDTSADDPNGIRLTEGAELGSALTLVSECPVYVQGDYNVVNKQPAAVIADSVNLLSNSWDDSKSQGNLPNATETTYQCAMITGADETEGSSYCGGFENLPRFHEKWSGVDCNIAGSFVKIYASDHARGKWKYGGDVYTAPRRKWDYDTMFNDAASLPPFTPNVAQVKSVGYWE